MAVRQIFWFFYVNQFGTGHLHNCLSLCDFDFEFSEIYVIENRFSVLLTRGVADSAYQWYPESRQLPVSVIRQVADSQVPTMPLKEQFGKNKPGM